MILICWLKEFFGTFINTVAISGHEFVLIDSSNKKLQILECSVCGYRSVGIV